MLNENKEKQQKMTVKKTNEIQVEKLDKVTKKQNN